MKDFRDFFPSTGLKAKDLFSSPNNTDRRKEMSFLSSIFGKKEQPKKISIRGPLEDVDGKMLLQIPLDAGGRDLAPFAKGIGRVEGESLTVEILPWLAEKLHIHAGSTVVVDNLEGKFRITRADEEPIQ